MYAHECTDRKPLILALTPAAPPHPLPISPSVLVTLPVSGLVVVAVGLYRFLTSVLLVLGFGLVWLLGCCCGAKKKKLCFSYSLFFITGLKIDSWKMEARPVSIKKFLKFGQTNHNNNHDNHDNHPATLNVHKCRHIAFQALCYCLMLISFCIQVYHNKKIQWDSTCIDSTHRIYNHCL